MSNMIQARAKQIAQDLRIVGADDQLEFLEAYLRLTREEGIAVGLRQAGEVFVPLRRAS